VGGVLSSRRHKRNWHRAKGLKRIDFLLTQPFRILNQLVVQNEWNNKRTHQSSNAFLGNKSARCKKVRVQRLIAEKTPSELYANIIIRTDGAAKHLGQVQE
jgi:hypothetical protein